MVLLSGYMVWCSIVVNNSQESPTIMQGYTTHSCEIHSNKTPTLGGKRKLSVLYLGVAFAISHKPLDHHGYCQVRCQTQLYTWRPAVCRRWPVELLPLTPKHSPRSMIHQYQARRNAATINKPLVDGGESTSHQPLTISQPFTILWSQPLTLTNHSGGFFADWVATLHLDSQLPGIQSGVWHKGVWVFIVVGCSPQGLSMVL